MREAVVPIDSGGQPPGRLAGIDRKLGQVLESAQPIDGARPVRLHASALQERPGRQPSCTPGADARAPLIPGGPGGDGSIHFRLDLLQEAGSGHSADATTGRRW
jgi:hypothetical protein